MTNGIYIDIDTERENPIRFAKSPDIPQPTNKEEAQAMVLNDIACISEALALLIGVADQNGYRSKMELVQAAINTLNSVLNEDNGPKETN